MGTMIPGEVVQNIFAQLKAQMQMTNLPNIQMTWRLKDGFFNIRIKKKCGTGNHNVGIETWKVGF